MYILIMIRLRSQRIKIAKTSLILSLIQVCLVVALRPIEVINQSPVKSVKQKIKSCRHYASSFPIPGRCFRIGF
jgi:hypothetical protein